MLLVYDLKVSKAARYIYSTNLREVTTGDAILNFGSNNNINNSNDEDNINRLSPSLEETLEL